MTHQERVEQIEEALIMIENAKDLIESAMLESQLKDYESNQCYGLKTALGSGEDESKSIRSIITDLNDKAEKFIESAEGDQIMNIRYYDMEKIEL